MTTPDDVLAKVVKKIEPMSAVTMTKSKDSKSDEDTEFTERNIIVETERVKGREEKCINCAVQLDSDTKKVSKIWRIPSYNKSGGKQGDRNTDKNEVSIGKALKLTFSCVCFEYDPIQHFVCEKCAKLLELAYNAFQDFLQLAKKGGILFSKLNNNATSRNNSSFLLNKTKVSSHPVSEPHRKRLTICKKNIRDLVIMGSNRGMRLKRKTLLKKKSLITSPIKNEVNNCNDIGEKSSATVEAAQNVEILSYRCSICDLDFIGGKRFREHLAFNHDDNVYPASDDNIRRGDEDDDEINDKRDNNASGKEKIFKKESKNDKTLLKCSVCEKTFTRQDHMKLHMRTHTGEKPFVCKICHKAFSDPRGLAYHEITHSSERPYCCTICGLTFKRLHHLNDHEKNHADVPRPFNCLTCGKAFKYKKHLNSHMITHQGTKEHRCDLCLKAFNRKDNLRQHIRKVHGIKQEELQQITDLSATSTDSNITPSTLTATSSNDEIKLGKIELADSSIENVVYMHL